MGWVMRERRGPEWKQGWANRTISSIAAPPLPLIALFAIVAFYLFLSSYFAYKTQVGRAAVNMRFLLFLLPVVLIFFMRTCTSDGGRLAVRIPMPEHDSIHRAGSSPWGVALLLLLLLILLSFQPSFHSNWFRPLWYSH